MSDMAAPSSAARSARIAVGDEGCRDDMGRVRLVADDKDERCVGLGMRARHIAQADRAPDGRAEPAAGHETDRPAGRVLDLRMLARGRAAIRPDADELARRTFAQLAQDRLGAWEAALLAPALGDRPGE